MLDRVYRGVGDARCCRWMGWEKGGSDSNRRSTSDQAIDFGITVQHGVHKRDLGCALLYSDIRRRNSLRMPSNQIQHITHKETMSTTTATKIHRESSQRLKNRTRRLCVKIIILSFNVENCGSLRSGRKCCGSQNNRLSPLHTHPSFPIACGVRNRESNTWSSYLEMRCGKDGGASSLDGDASDAFFWSQTGQATVPLSFSPPSPPADTGGKSSKGTVQKDTSLSLVLQISLRGS